MDRLYKGQGFIHKTYLGPFCLVMNLGFHNLKYRQIVVGLIRDIKANVVWTTIQKQLFIVYSPLFAFQ